MIISKSVLISILGKEIGVKTGRDYYPMLLLGTKGINDVVGYLPTNFYVTNSCNVLVIATKTAEKGNFCPSAM